VIFDLVVRYKPKDDELYDILNILEDRLKHSSSAVVLGCIKAFLVYTSGDERLTS
jgi:AP-4 complex subunit beta-1